MSAPSSPSLGLFRSDARPGPLTVPPPSLEATATTTTTTWPDPRQFVVGAPPNPPSPSAFRALTSPSNRRATLADPTLPLGHADSIRKRSSLPADIDLSTLDYITACDENLICPICRCPLDKPVRLACDHIFCDECLNRALEAQRSGERNCPSCRTRVHGWSEDAAKQKHRMSIPRILTQMLDELVVKCPNGKAGCKWQDKRGEVQDHVDRYCDYTLLACPESECGEVVPRKYRGKSCLHFHTKCEDCEQSVLQLDLEAHQESKCPKRAEDCPKCGANIPVRELKSHLSSKCPETIVSCSGSPYGCSFQSPHADLKAHTEKCPIAAMAPFLNAQQARQDAQEAQQKLLQRKIDVLEGGFSSIQSLLYTSDPGTRTPTTPLEGMSNPMLRSGSNNGAASSTTTAPAAENPPFDSSTEHLLFLHDSLRNEISRVENALAILDARTTMTLLNESLRAKEEMAHTNAAINGMRMQLHWLMSARLQAQREQSGPRAGPSVGGGGPGGAAGASAPLLRPVRRASEESRQKL
ncbi:hypothetical protein H2201_009063 [Coniosporium apollinis]|uniref:RING-type domain-containing protein n=2 Tax=Coniosporium TaxID=2810619 RepID=A0ABQ9NET2_9PEZI|nr:hypothetical protein H2199_001954 [Cladosporium sp. JES 115]KAJ9654005.1 hypothetical protein H2201_009063 [Coniosporium apollinis]